MTVKGSARPLTLYTLDIAEDALNLRLAEALDPTVLPSQAEAAAHEQELARRSKSLLEEMDEGAYVGAETIEAEKEALEELDHEARMFRRTAAVYEMRRTTTPPFLERWGQALSLYLAGEWAEAIGHFEACGRMLPDDGPTRTLMAYIKRRSCQAPPGWDGARADTRRVMPARHARAAPRCRASDARTTSSRPRGPSTARCARCARAAPPSTPCRRARAHVQIGIRWRGAPP